MAECKPTEKSATKEVDLTSISNILDVLLGAFNVLQKPAQSIPPPLMLLGKSLRPGMSARNLAARTISRLESETGVSMGNVFQDGPNVKAAMVTTMASEMVTMLQTETKTQVVIDPGAIQITAAGTAGPIPVVVQGANTLYASGSGGII